MGAGAKPSAELVARAREVLRAHPEGLRGGLDGWASLLGVKLIRARAACRHLEELGEVEVLWEAGRQLRRWKARDDLQ